jgi:hypothetical protein
MKRRYVPESAVCDKRHLGYFDDEVVAARAYDAAAKAIHGDYAHVNFPEEVA